MTTSRDAVTTRLQVTAGPYVFAGMLEDERAPQTCAAFRGCCRSAADHPLALERRGVWIPLGDLDVGVGFENATSHPAPGEILLYPGGTRETEILFPYGGAASPAASASWPATTSSPSPRDREPARARRAHPVEGRAGHRVRGGRMRFAVNVSILFKEVPFLERFARARAAGLRRRGVLVAGRRGPRRRARRGPRRRAGGRALINFDAGDMPAGDRGLLSDPARDEALPRQRAGRARAGARQLAAGASTRWSGSSSRPSGARSSSRSRGTTSAGRPTGAAEHGCRGPDRGRQHVRERPVPAPHDAPGGGLRRAAWAGPT